VLVVFHFDHVMGFSRGISLCLSLYVFIMDVLLLFNSCMTAPYLPNFSLSVIFCNGVVVRMLAPL
jgi:hypothetical protein